MEQPTGQSVDTTVSIKRERRLPRINRVHLCLDPWHGPPSKLDGYEKLAGFCTALEAVCVETIESEKMTKDLAICIKGMDKAGRSDYLDTLNFWDALAEYLKAKLACAS